MGGRRPGRRRADAALRRLRVLPRGPVSLCTERGRVGADENGWMGAFARYKKIRADGMPAGARQPRAAARRARRAARGRAARPHPGRRARPASGYSSPAPGRSASSRWPRRAHGASPTSWSASRTRAARRWSSGSGRGPVDPDSLVGRRRRTPSSTSRSTSRSSARGHPAAMQAALAQLRRAGTLVLVGAGIRQPALRQQPHPAERADDHGLRSSTTPTASSGRSSCWRRRSSRPTRSSSPTTSALDDILGALRRTRRRRSRGEGDDGAASRFVSVKGEHDARDHERAGVAAAVQPRGDVGTARPARRGRAATSWLLPRGVRLRGAADGGRSTASGSSSAAGASTSSSS